MAAEKTIGAVLVNVDETLTIALEGYVKSEANMEALLDLAEAQTVQSYTLTFVSGSEWAFEAYVKMIKEGEVTPDGVRKFVGSLRISGAPVYTPVAPSV
jgi:hypothetical protein